MPPTADHPTPQAGPETVAVRVNGKPVVVPLKMLDPSGRRKAATTIIQACKLAGVEVPHFCYHPKLAVAGSCRMCLVEYGTPAIGPDRKPVRRPDGSPVIIKSARPAIACATPISPDMEIYTDTPAVKRMREAVMEFLLLNHPLDCPICDQAGECQLQEYAVDHGFPVSRFQEQKLHKPKQVELGPRIMLDDERCILCSRCIRFSRDLARDDALGFIRRGAFTTLTTYPGRHFDNNYSLNTVDICPVGALTSKDFRFRMRVWFLKETPSLCASCARGCNLLIGSRENRIYRFVPRENDAVNSCWMCDEGRLNYKWIGRPDRLTECLARGPEGKPWPTTWPAALSAISTSLRAGPPGSVAIVASGRQTNEELYLLSLLAKHLGALTDAPPRTGQGDGWLRVPDQNPNSNGAELLGLAANPPGSRLPRLLEAVATGQVKTLLVFGEDLAKHGFSPALLGRLEMLVLSDILPNPTAEQAHYLLPGCAHTEKAGTFINCAGRVQRFFKAVEPPGQARPEAEFLTELVGGVTGTELPGSVAAMFNRLANDIPAMQGMKWETLGAAGADLGAEALSRKA